MKIKLLLTTIALTIATSSALALETVKMITTGTDPFTPLTLLPYFCKKQDLNIELTQSPKHAPANGVTVLMRGDYDVANSTFSVTLNALSNGADIVVAAAVVDGGDVLISRNDIHSVKELKGKKVGALKGTGQEFYLMKALAKAGLSYTGENPDVTIVHMPLDIQPVAFENGSIDAFTAVYPYSVQYAESKKGRILEEFSENQRPLMAMRSFFNTEKSKKFYKCYEETFHAINNPKRKDEIDNAIAYARTLGLRTAVIPTGQYSFKPNHIVRDSSITDFEVFLKATGKLRQDFIVPSWFNHTKQFGK